MVKVKNIERIQNQTEKQFVDFLRKALDDGYEVYCYPRLVNGDSPTIVIMRRRYGVIIVDVCKSHSKIDEEYVKSVIDRSIGYKKTLIGYSKDLMASATWFKSFSKVFIPVVYLSDVSTQSFERIKDCLPDKYKRKLSYEDCEIMCSDALNDRNFEGLIYKLRNEYKAAVYFDDEIFAACWKTLNPPIHHADVGKTMRYTEKQKEIINSSILERRVMGVFGSGKTTVLVARAVQAYFNAINRGVISPHILILTYNITLRNFILDKLKMVPEEFPMSAFTVINYHSFLGMPKLPIESINEINNKAISEYRKVRPFANIDGSNTQVRELSIERYMEIRQFREIWTKVRWDYIEKNYYSNIRVQTQLMEIKKRKQFNAVFIDEVQDWKRAWMDIIKQCYRDVDGEYYLFGDEKQNIYNHSEIDAKTKDIHTNVRGVVNLKTCFRADSKILMLAEGFQRRVLSAKYNVDEFEKRLNSDTFLGEDYKKEGYIEYRYLNERDSTTALYKIIQSNIINKRPNEITILGCSDTFLREFDLYYRFRSQEKTLTTFEMVEYMYFVELKNVLEKKDVDRPEWFNKIFEGANQYYYNKQGSTGLNDKDNAHIINCIANLFCAYDLYLRYGNNVFQFRDILEQKCNKCGYNIDGFISFRNKYSEEINSFRQTVFWRKSYEENRRVKKLDFNPIKDKLKISTIYSFKGLEAETVYLIIENNTNVLNDELIYTGLTRARQNLVIINMGNPRYDGILRSLVEQINR